MNACRSVSRRTVASALHQAQKGTLFCSRATRSFRPVLCPSRNGIHHHNRRLFSDSTATNNNNSLLVDSGLYQLARHAKGDAVIILNVGGKEFTTLRSTVATNEVLAECVARAEANQEFTCDAGKAVFIDRDPTYFPLILQHLRNKVDGLSYTTKHKALFKSSSTIHVQLPKDLHALRDIYVEASHYKIPELQSASCNANLVTTILGAFGAGAKGGNPFDMASKMFQNLRRGLVTVGSVGTIVVTSQQDLGKVMATLFPAWFTTANGENDNDRNKKDISTTNHPEQAAT